MGAILRAKLVVAFAEFSFGGGVFAEDFSKEGFGLLEDTVEVIESVFVLF